MEKEKVPTELEAKIKELGKSIKEKSEAARVVMEDLAKERQKYYNLMYENNKYFMRKDENVTAFIKVRSFIDDTIYCDISVKSKIGNSVGTAEFKVFDPTVKAFSVIAEEDYEKGDLSVLSGLELRRTSGIVLIK